MPRRFATVRWRNAQSKCPNPAAHRGVRHKVVQLEAGTAAALLRRNLPQQVEAQHLPAVLQELLQALQQRGQSGAGTQPPSVK